MARGRSRFASALRASVSEDTKRASLLDSAMRFAAFARAPQPLLRPALHASSGGVL